ALLMVSGAKEMLKRPRTLIRQARLTSGTSRHATLRITWTSKAESFKAGAMRPSVAWVLLRPWKHDRLAGGIHNQDGELVPSPLRAWLRKSVRVFTSCRIVRAGWRGDTIFRAEST